MLFVNLGLRARDLAELSSNPGYMHVVHDVLQAVQTAVYKYEGSLNKFLMDDKGSTLVAVFGLPPLAHEDDSVRGVLAALAICAKVSGQTGEGYTKHGHLLAAQASITLMLI